MKKENEKFDGAAWLAFKLTGDPRYVKAIFREETKQKSDEMGL